ncbi:hypothetical protein L13192_02687 [Pyrenophora tritici-repentis]|nr:hypothetical protein L13192_02687 [Pyrenophora tritici-repentis]
MAANPSIPKADGTCYFFKLSGEVRNMIYSYRLHEPRGFLYIPTAEGQGKFYTHNGNPKDTTASSHVANQIMDTCRQLRSETARLKRRYNELHFVNYKDAISFFENFNAREYRFLRSFYIGPLPSTFFVGQFLDICHNHPHITVLVRSPSNSISTSDDYIIYQCHERQRAVISELMKKFDLCATYSTQV